MAAAMAIVGALINSAGAAAANDAPPAPSPFPADLCPAVHIHGGIHDPSGARYDVKTGVWHLLLDAGGGVGHAWSKDLVHWIADPTYPWDTMADVPETGSVTVTPAGTFFIYAGLGGPGAGPEQGAFRAVSADQRNWSEWITGPGNLNGSRAAAVAVYNHSSRRCPTYPCEWNVIPRPADNPHDFRDPSEAFLHTDGSWYLTMGSTSTPGGPDRLRPYVSQTAAPRVFRAVSDSLESFQEVGFIVQTNTSAGGGSSNITSGAWDEAMPANMLVMECPSFFPLVSETGVRRHVLYGSMLCGNATGPGRAVQPAGYAPWRQCHQEVWVGDFDPAAVGDKLVNISHHAVMDYGLWYAARGAPDLSTTVAGTDPTQHVVFGWIHNFDGAGPAEMVALQKSCGAQYTLPRLLKLTDDGSEMRLLPLPALQHLHLPSAQGTASHESIDVHRLLVVGRTVSRVKGTVAHLQALLPCNLTAAASFFGVHVLTGRNETTLVGWDSALGRVSIDRRLTSATGAGHTSPMTAKLPGGCPGGSLLNLTIVLDGGILELFANDMIAITAALWPTEQIPPAARQLGLIVVPSSSRQPERLLSASGTVTLDAWKLQTKGVLVPETRWYTTPPPGPPAYAYHPRIHWAQGCLEGCIRPDGTVDLACRAGTHDISGGIIQADGSFHSWVGCFSSEPGGGWQHIVSKDLLSWKLETSFTGESLGTQDIVGAAGAVGIDDDGAAFAVKSNSAGKAPEKSGEFPYHAYRFTNSSNNAWSEPKVLFSYVTNRGLPGDPPRPWKDPRDNKWYALLSFNGCNESMVAQPSQKAQCPRGGEAKMWSSPALFGPRAKWTQTPSLLITNRTVLDGENGLPNRPSMTEMVTSDFFPLQGHKLVNAVYITSRYRGAGPINGSGVKPDPDGPGEWNYLIAYVGHQAAPGQPMTVLHRVCLDWGSFVRTSGWHGLDAATDAGTTFGIGKSMRSAEGKGDTGRRILFAWMSNGYWDGHAANYEPEGLEIYAPGLPKDSLSLPRDMTFAADGRLLQRFVPELERLRIAESYEQLPLTALHDGALVWLKTAGRQLEIFARFEVAGNCSFGLHVLASKPSLTEFTTIGVDITDDLTFVDRLNSSGANPLVPNRGLLDVRAGLLPPDRSSDSNSPEGAAAEGNGNGTRTIEIHVIVDGPIVTFIVSNETALSVFVYPQLQSSDGVALWSSAGTGAAGAGATVRASADVWQLRSVFNSTD